ncbi:MAG: hypothetical protein U0836_24060 [Pirellulales bacterium]
MSDFSLTRDGVNVTLSGPGQSISGSGTLYTLNGLTTLTTPPGVYILTLNAVGSGIVTDTPPIESLSNSPSEKWALVQPWPGTTSCFRTAHLFHQSGIPTTEGGGLAHFPIDNITWNSVLGLYVVTLTGPFPLDQDWTDGDYVAIEQQLGNANLTGVWKIRTFDRPNLTFRLDGVPNTGNANGGRAARWHPARWNSVCTFSVSAAGMRGLTQGVNLINKNFLVPYNVSDNIRRVSLVSKGASAGTGLEKLRLTTDVAHGFVTGQIVEVAGVRVSDGSETAHGWWPVTKISNTEIDLEIAYWPGPGVENTGIVSTTADAIGCRTRLLSGDTFNPSAPVIVNLNDVISNQKRGYQQGMDDFRGWFESHIFGKKPGYYFSGSAVSTPHAILERGIQAAYPMIVTPLDGFFTNQWNIASSQSNSGKLEVTVSGGRTPQSLWAGKVRVALIGHSNTSYCLDPHLDKNDTSPGTGGSGLRRLNGYVGTSSAGGTTTTLVDSTRTNAANNPFPLWLVNCQLRIESGANTGLSRTIVAVDQSTGALRVDSAFPSAIGAGVSYRAGHLGFPVVSVSGQNIVLDTPFRGANGAGGNLIVMGNLAASNSVLKGGPNPSGGEYVRIKTEVAHGLTTNDYIAVFGVTPTAQVNYSWGSLVDATDGVTVHRVVTVVSATDVDIDRTWVGNGNGGRWYGTCLSWPGEPNNDGRIDTPDFRRSEVRSSFFTKQKAMITDAFTRHGARHIGFLDECAFRYTSSAGSALVINGPLSGESTDQIISRISDLGDWVMSEYARKMTVNTTAWLTRDTFSAAQRSEVINHWGGLMSEGACFLPDRSVYQMDGTDGYLGHINALLTGGARYYYAPQEVAPASIVVKPIASSGGNGNFLAVRTAQDSGTSPTEEETTNEATKPHNRAGSLVGIFGHSIAAVNGVHRVRSRQTNMSVTNQVTLETLYSAGTGGATGTLVHCAFAPPMKIVSIAAAPLGTRVTTEFPHGIPDATDEITEVVVFGYTAISSAARQKAVRFDDKNFDLPDVAYSANPATGICFYCRADLWHWLGLSYMLWQSGKALEYSSGGVTLPVNTRRAYIPDGPGALVPDGPYTRTSFNGIVSAINGSLPKRTVIATALSKTPCWHWPASGGVNRRTAGGHSDVRHEPFSEACVARGVAGVAARVAAFLEPLQPSQVHATAVVCLPGHEGVSGAGLSHGRAAVGRQPRSAEVDRSRAPAPLHDVAQSVQATAPRRAGTPSVAGGVGPRAPSGVAAAARGDRGDRRHRPARPGRQPSLPRAARGRKRWETQAATSNAASTLAEADGGLRLRQSLDRRDARRAWSGERHAAFSAAGVRSVRRGAAASAGM